MVNDSGAESYLHYASDITRTFPVDGKFTNKQKEIYELVLKSQLDSIKAIKPGKNSGMFICLQQERLLWA